MLRYRPLPGVVLRVTDAVTDDEIAVARLAASACGTDVEVSSPSPRHGCGAITIESEEALGIRLAEVAAARLRIPGGASDELRTVAMDAGLSVDDNTIVDHGRIELLRWVREQSITRTTHRYGTVL